MKSKVKDVVDFLHSIAPNNLQEGYDNAGLIVGTGAEDVTGVMVSLDCTLAVIEEAIANGCNLVVSHHPIVFKGLKRFNEANYVEKAIMKAIKNDICLFAIHTNLDNVYQNGVNTRIANKIGMKNLEILCPKAEDSRVGSGMIGEMPEPFSLNEFLAHTKESMELNVIKYTPSNVKSIKTIAVCGGSGSFLLNEAIAQNADVFITADFKYHEFFDHNDKIVIMDIGHYESERFTIDLLFELISNKFSTFAAHCTKINTNPVKYF